MTTRNTRRLQIVIGLLLTLGVGLLPLGQLGRDHSGLGLLLGGEICLWGDCPAA